MSVPTEGELFAVAADLASPDFNLPTGSTHDRWETFASKEIVLLTKSCRSCGVAR